jgi:hypothetical protein
VQAHQEIVRQVAGTIPPLHPSVAQQELQERRLTELAELPLGRRRGQLRHLRGQITAGDDQPRAPHQVTKQMAVEPGQLGIEDLAAALVEVALEVIENQHEPAPVQPGDQRPQTVGNRQRRVA